jgi:hypothetical protein
MDLSGLPPLAAQERTNFSSQIGGRRVGVGFEKKVLPLGGDVDKLLYGGIKVAMVGHRGD